MRVTRASSAWAAQCALRSFNRRYSIGIGTAGEFIRQPAWFLSAYFAEGLFGFSYCR